MRPALVTILPMLAAAVLVMAGGERMARRDVEKRTPPDRTRLLDLADAFRRELLRLDVLYLDHLRDLARNSLFVKPDEAASMTAEISGVRLIRIFRQKGSDLTILPDPQAGPLPEVELEKRKRPLNEQTAVIIGKRLLDESLDLNGTWLSTSDPNLRVHCNQPEPGVLAVFLIDVTKVRERTAGHLVDWLATPLTPLREAGERVRIESPQGAALVSTGLEKHGPAALILPTRNLSGDWQIRAWDGLVVAHTHTTPRRSRWRQFSRFHWWRPAGCCFPNRNAR